jgi:hypothetical protein
MKRGPRKNLQAGTLDRHTAPSSEIWTPPLIPAAVSAATKRVEIRFQHFKLRGSDFLPEPSRQIEIAVNDLPPASSGEHIRASKATRLDGAQLWLAAGARRLAGTLAASAAMTSERLEPRLALAVGYGARHQKRDPAGPRDPELPLGGIEPPWRSSNNYRQILLSVSLHSWQAG